MQPDLTWEKIEARAKKELGEKCSNDHSAYIHFILKYGTHITRKVRLRERQEAAERRSLPPLTVPVSPIPPGSPSPVLLVLCRSIQSSPALGAQEPTPARVVCVLGEATGAGGCRSSSERRRW